MDLNPTPKQNQKIPQDSRIPSPTETKQQELDASETPKETPLQEAARIQCALAKTAAGIAKQVKDSAAKSKPVTPFKEPVSSVDLPNLNLPPLQCSPKPKSEKSDKSPEVSEEPKRRRKPSQLYLVQQGISVTNPNDVVVLCWINLAGEDGTLQTYTLRDQAVRNARDLATQFPGAEFQVIVRHATIKAEQVTSVKVTVDERD